MELQDIFPLKSDKNGKILHLTIFMLICLVLMILNGKLFEIIQNHLLNEEFSNPIDSQPVFDQILFGVIVGPAIETVIFQYGLNKILLRLNCQNFYLLLIVPSIFFALAHLPYNYVYALATFFGGLILNYFFLKSKTNSNSALIFTILIHSLYNLYAFFS